MAKVNDDDDNLVIKRCVGRYELSSLSIEHLAKKEKELMMGFCLVDR
jgi:hypothetical protein